MQLRKIRDEKVPKSEETINFNAFYFCFVLASDLTSTDRHHYYFCSAEELKCIRNYNEKAFFNLLETKEFFYDKNN